MLSIAVFFAVQAIFPPKKPAPSAITDSTAAKTAASTPDTTTTVHITVPGASGIVGVPVNAMNAGAAVPATRPETTVVAVRQDSGATFAISNIGATPVSVVMNAYANRARSGKVDLVAERSLVKYQIVTNKKVPIDLSSTAFTTVHHGDTVTYTAPVTSNGVSGTVSIQYVFGTDGHLVRVQGSATGIDAGYLVIVLPETFTVAERDSASDLNAYAYSYDSKRDGTRSVLFSKLDPGDQQLVEGPITWVAAKSKYFVVGLLAPKGGRPFEELDLTGGVKTSKVATRGHASVVVPIANSGQFAFDLYTGPQEWRRLHAVGQDFDQVNPYGWAIFRGFLQPIATSVIRLVLWMHRELQLSYGWVLIVLGVLIRLILWPLNQSAMRTSLKMQRLQPELQAVQERYKNDREKQQQAMMQVYKEHNMNPLSPLTGCLPMFLPMPILLALFFVFQNTIEFRGVPFLWLNDLSAHDPYYILPVLMAASMYLLSWLGMRNMPSNPQSKMMSYMMPGMFLLFLGRAAAGLNLYYAAQNLAALPQQWLLIRDRGKQNDGTGSSGASATKTLAKGAAKSSKKG